MRMTLMTHQRFSNFLGPEGTTGGMHHLTYDHNRCLHTPGSRPTGTWDENGVPVRLCWYRHGNPMKFGPAIELMFRASGRLLCVYYDDGSKETFESQGPTYTEWLES